MDDFLWLKVSQIPMNLWNLEPSIQPRVRSQAFRTQTFFIRWLVLILSITLSTVMTVPLSKSIDTITNDLYPIWELFLDLTWQRTCKRAVFTAMENFISLDIRTITVYTLYRYLEISPSCPIRLQDSLAAVKREHPILETLAMTRYL